MVQVYPGIEYIKSAVNISLQVPTTSNEAKDLSSCVRKYFKNIKWDFVPNTFKY